MTRSRLLAIVIALVVPGLPLSGAQEETLAARAFEHYEAIRTALSNDTLDGVETHGTTLTPLAEQLAGPTARKAGEELAQAKNLEDARVQFGTLSEALMPAFMKADLPGVHGFMCSMKKQPWAQKGEEVQNPYYGKSMPKCGNPLEATSQDGR